MEIREYAETDFDQVWPIFHEIVAAGETYAFARDTTREQALELWIDKPRKTFVVEDNGTIFGTYYLKTNQDGPGSHVCNCGYMVSPAARGKGLATLMREHSQKVALELGYMAMQFNFVAATNSGAIRLWHKLGYETVGMLPNAFNHPKEGLVNALVMYNWLAR